MKVLLIGQPNSGKSTIFNSVIGYKSISSNIAGVTIEFTSGKTIVDFQTLELIDLPGVYSLLSIDKAEEIAVDYLLKCEEEYIILNVIDTSVLSRSLELTLQLMELQKPMVIALNMIDDAERKGITIDPVKLSEVLGIPIFKTIASKGTGIPELFQGVVDQIKKRQIPKLIGYSSETEEIISKIENIIKNNLSVTSLNSRFLAIEFIEINSLIRNYIKDRIPEDDFNLINKLAEKYELKCGEKLNHFFHKERHSSSFEIFEKVAKVGQKKKKTFLDNLDDILTHPILGYISLVIILFLVFQSIFKFGGILEPVFVENFDNLSLLIAKFIPSDSILYSMLHGATIGFGGGIAIVIPYLLPFFIILAFMEDTGYLARIAYLLDNIMHKIGLHGLSVVPLILGYGCTVPSIIATRILKSRKDKLITATLATLVPCTARMTTIFALVGFFISIEAALLIYIINLIIIIITGKILSKIFTEVSPGFIMEMPSYHLPSIKAIFNKTWFRLKEFVVIAWPLLIIGSVILELINYFNLTEIINSFLSPFTEGILGLPAIVGITLIFGLLRKELTIILLFSVIGTNELLSIMTKSQIFSYTIFITFYVPCLATFAALMKEIKLGNAILVSFLSFLIAVLLSIIVRFSSNIF